MAINLFPVFDKLFRLSGGLNRQFCPTSAEVDVVKAVAKRKTTKPGRFIDVDLIVLASLLLFYCFHFFSRNSLLSRFWTPKSIGPLKLSHT